MSTHADWAVEDEVGTHLQDIEALGTTLAAAAPDPHGLLTKDSILRIGWMIERSARKGMDCYLQERKAKLEAVRIG